jgi:hypothetical protein
VLDLAPFASSRRERSMSPNTSGFRLSSLAPMRMARCDTPVARAMIDIPPNPRVAASAATMSPDPLI